MKRYFITFRSVTFAQRGERIFRRNGIRCTLRRTPKWMEEQGCGYSLLVDTRDISGTVALLERSRIPWRKVYLSREDGGLEEVTV